jgi:hypothetical protein
VVEKPLALGSRGSSHTNQQVRFFVSQSVLCCTILHIYTKGLHFYILILIFERRAAVNPSIYYFSNEFCGT